MLECKICKNLIISTRAIYMYASMTVMRESFQPLEGGVNGDLPRATIDIFCSSERVT
jgi:hypothetical protein